jgi:hypothetical protein
VEKTAEDVVDLVQLRNFAELPPKMHKRVLKTAVTLLDEIDSIPEDEKAEILSEIDDFEKPEVEIPPFIDEDEDPEDEAA